MPENKIVSPLLSSLIFFRLGALGILASTLSVGIIVTIIVIANNKTNILLSAKSP